VRITGWSLYRTQVGYRRPIMLGLESERGLIGYGEAGIAYGAGGDAAVALISELVERFVIGREYRFSRQIVQQLVDRGFWGKAPGPIFSSSVSAIELALWDLTGRELGVPVTTLFGGPVRDEVPVYANGWWFGCVTPEEHAQAAKRAVADGFSLLKFYPLAVPDEDSVIRHPDMRHVSEITLRRGQELVQVTQEAVGDSAGLLLDLGGGISIDQTRQFLSGIQNCDVRFVEEPVAPNSHAGLRALTADMKFSVAAGERHYTINQYADLLRDGVSILQPDPTSCGGFAQYDVICRMAEAANARVSPHNYGGDWATVIAIQAAAITPALYPLEFFPYISEEPGYQMLCRDTFVYRDGFVSVGDSPGFGLGPRDVDSMAEHLVMRG
jgi:galactonate dehydratase